MTSAFAEVPVAAFDMKAFDLLAVAAQAGTATTDNGRGDAVPNEAWELDDLTARVMAEQELIKQTERAPARHYWYQGKALNAARRHFSRNHWGKYLKTCGISKDQARCARKLAMFYASAAALGGLSVRESLRLARGDKSRDRDTSRLLRNLTARLQKAVKAACDLAQTVSTGEERTALAATIDRTRAAFSALARDLEKQGDRRGNGPTQSCFGFQMHER